jgi:hypothetical protein
MGRGRKKEKRSQLAGERFKIAKTIFGKSYEKLVKTGPIGFSAIWTTTEQ